jgi:hypothetical protein
MQLLRENFYNLQFTKLIFPNTSTNTTLQFSYNLLRSTQLLQSVPDWSCVVASFAELVTWSSCQSKVIDRSDSRSWLTVWQVRVTWLIYGSCHFLTARRNRLAVDSISTLCRNCALNGWWNCKHIGRSVDWWWPANCKYYMLWALLNYYSTCLS